MAELAVAALVVAAMYGIGLCNGSRSHIGGGVDGRALRSGELRRPGGRRRGVSVDWSFWVPMASCGLCCWGFFPSGAFAPQRNTAATAISRFTNNQVIQVKHLQVAFKMLLANAVACGLIFSPRNHGCSEGIPNDSRVIQFRLQWFQSQLSFCRLGMRREITEIYYVQLLCNGDNWNKIVVALKLGHHLLKDICGL